MAVVAVCGGLWQQGRATNGVVAGVECSIFLNQNWILGVGGCWRGAGEAGGKLSLTKVSTQK
jgi:hypothetical protein